MLLLSWSSIRSSCLRRAACEHFQSFYFKEPLRAITQPGILQCPSQALKEGPRISSPARKFPSKSPKTWFEHLEVRGYYQYIQKLQRSLQARTFRTESWSLHSKQPNCPATGPCFCQNTHPQSINNFNMRLQSWTFPCCFSLLSWSTHPLRTGMLCSRSTLTKHLQIMWYSHLSPKGLRDSSPK